MAKTSQPVKNVARPSARPGQAAPVAQPAKERKTRVDYPNIPEGGLDAVPEDFSPSVHLPLKRTAFKQEHMWFEMRADILERAAAKMRKQAELSKSLGSKGERAKVKRLARVSDQIAKLREELIAAGHDPDALLSMMMSSKAAVADDGDDDAAE